jgi:RNA polymerase sigma factor (TIGR02999 family)
MRSSSIAATNTSGQPDVNPQPDAETLFGELYAELHRLAKRQLARDGSYASLGVTTLLHEAYLDISSRHSAVFADEAHFMGYAARVMRGLIIDHARAQHAAKRGGEYQLTSLKTDDLEVAATPRELGAISEALDELATLDRTLAEIVDLKFFCGFSFGEIAAMRGMSERSVQRQWERARVYLFARIRGQASDGS